MNPTTPTHPYGAGPIHQWLRLLAGNAYNYQKLLDWMAVAPDLDKPLCGLILAGPPQTGKSLFVEGLRHLWDHIELDPTKPVALMVYRDCPPLPYVVAEKSPFTRFVTAARHPTTLVEGVKTSLDLHTIERRWLYCEHTEAAAEHLATYISRLETWATQEIAATAEALRQNRKVDRAGHLWVEGDIGAMAHLVGKKEATR